MRKPLLPVIMLILITLVTAENIIIIINNYRVYNGTGGIITYRTTPCTNASYSRGNKLTTLEIWKTQLSDCSRSMPNHVN